MAQGSVFFSSKSVTNNMAGIKDSLRNDFYRYPALQPQMLWLDVVFPNPPYELTAKSVNRGVALSWREGTVSEDGEKAYGYVIYRFAKGSTINIGNPANIVKISFNASEKSFTDTSVSANNTYVYVVTTIDRLKNESAVSNVAEVRVLQ